MNDITMLVRKTLYKYRVKECNRIYCWEYYTNESGVLFFRKHRTEAFNYRHEYYNLFIYHFLIRLDVELPPKYY